MFCASPAVTPLSHGVASHRRSSRSLLVTAAAHQRQSKPSVRSTTTTTTTPATAVPLPSSSSRRGAIASIALAPLAAAALTQQASFPPSARADTECTECSNSNSSLGPGDVPFKQSESGMRYADLRVGDGRVYAQARLCVSLPLSRSRHPCFFGHDPRPCIFPQSMKEPKRLPSPFHPQTPPHFPQQVSHFPVGIDFFVKKLSIIFNVLVYVCERVC